MTFENATQKPKAKAKKAVPKKASKVAVPESKSETVQPQHVTRAPNESLRKRVQELLRETQKDEASRVPAKIVQENEEKLLSASQSSARLSSTDGISPVNTLLRINIPVVSPMRVKEFYSARLYSDSTLRV